MGKFAALLWVLLAVFLVACGGESETIEDTSPAEVADIEESATTTPLPPTATSVPPTDTPVSPTNTAVIVEEPINCESVEGVCLELTFDGENCVYEGPTEVKAGPITYIFVNSSDGIAFTRMLRHPPDKTVQDMIDHFGVEPSSNFSPVWAIYVESIIQQIGVGRSYTWEVELEPGIHSLICVRNVPYGVYIGEAFTVVQ